ncbi:hypothetical protein PRIPAC_73695 [Pristionchus pacificus]|uniref:Neurotransmitter transporter n=1 Tax=Pristionchus pacificus TaxID=54126 RepID=A0A2A6C1A1_PRIPA|nr:hypothetical protein PRIPAC_73695 [Pristionchus pacificus]|eukprot:PDM71945.1 neurotransmitter transporter [Pristionchus pacificus]
MPSQQPPPSSTPLRSEPLRTESVGTKPPVRQSTERIGTDEDIDYEEDAHWLPDHDDPKRPEFDNKSKYYLTLIGFALGNGNFWRIPSGNFLLQYYLCMVVFGLPTLYLELTIGQMTQTGVQRAFGMYAPILQGVGWAMCLLSFARAVNYNLLNTYSLHYMIDSLFGVSMYTSCEHEWNTKFCISHRTSQRKCGNYTKASAQQHYWYQGTCHHSSAFNNSQVNKMRFASKEYFEYAVRGMDAGEVEFQIASWGPIICLFLCWLFLCISLVRKEQFLGKRSLYIVSTSSVIFSLFLVHVCSMAHVGGGIKRYFTPDFALMKNPDSWAAAVNESCQSLCLGMGGMVTMSSYNKRSNDAFRDALVMVVVMTIASTMAGLEAYAVWGLIMHNYEFADWDSALLRPQGQAFYFADLPEIMQEMQMYKLWQFVFYAMLLCIGISTMFGLLEIPVAALTDQFRWCRQHRATMIFLMCTGGFLLGLVNLTKMGFNIFYQSEILAFSIVSIYLVALELLVMIVYGPRNFYRDIFGALGRSVNRFGQWLSPYGFLIRLVQVFVAPVLTLFAAITFHLLIKKILKLWHTRLTDKHVKFVPTLIYSITFLLWPIVAVGAIKAVVDNVRAKRPWLALVSASHEHPAIRYSLPAPCGNFFSPRAIEVAPMPTPCTPSVEVVAPSSTNRSPILVSSKLTPAPSPIPSTLPSMA